MKNRDDWYAYIYPKNFIVLSNPKLVIPDISEKMRVAPDYNGDIIFSGGGAGGNAIIPHNKDLFEFLMGVLNSHLAETFVRQNGTQFRGGYLNCEVRFIRDIPIPIFRNSSDHKLKDKIVERVKKIIEGKSIVKENKLADRERQRYEREIEANESRINELVCELYGVDKIPD